MEAVRIRRKLESDTLTLPELRPFVGKTVEIVVEEVLPPDVLPGSGDWDAAAQAVRELRETALRFQGMA